MLASQIYLLALISLSLPLLFANCLFTNSQKVVSLALGGGQSAADAAGVAVAALPGTGGGVTHTSRRRRSWRKNLQSGSLASRVHLTRHRTALLLLGRAFVSELVGYGQFSKATKRMRKKECSNGAEL